MTTKVNLRRRLLLIAISLCAVLALSCLLTGKVEAADIIKKGTINEDIPYTISSDGVMVIGDGSVYSGLGSSMGGTDFGGPFVNSLKGMGRDIKKIIFKGRIITDWNISGYFRGLPNLQEIQGIENLNTSAVKNCSNMFENCASLKSVDLSRWNTSNLTDASGMFYGCESLKSVNISTWNTENVEKLNEMFYGCSSLTSLNLSNWNTENVHNTNGMFYGCSQLKSLDLYNWDLTKTTEDWYFVRESLDKQHNMFYGANSLEKIRLGAKYVFQVGTVGNTYYHPALRKESGAYRWYKEGTNNSYTANEMERLNPQKNNPGWYVYTNKGSGSNSGGGSRQTMYRLYNLNSGEHFYTKDINERNHLVSLGWKNEGVGWIAPASGSPVYRLYNRNGGEHHYTLSIKERNMLISAGWKDEGVGWYSGGDVPVYREYNPNAFANNHNYTPDKTEHDHLVSLGWHNEGIGWYAKAAK